MSNYRILAIDYGEKRVGLAVGSGDLALPLEILIVKSLDDALAQILAVIKAEKIDTLLLGLPADSASDQTAIVKRVKAFGQKLQEASHLPLKYWSESLTSKEALVKIIESGRPKKKRRYLDDTAAAIFLQEYLDSLGC